MAVLASWSFDVPRCSPPTAGFAAFHAEAERERPTLGFDIDGTVIKVESFHIRIETYTA